MNTHRVTKDIIQKRAYIPCSLGNGNSIPQTRPFCISHHGQGAGRNTRTTPKRKITLEKLIIHREGCPGEASRNPKDWALRTPHKKMAASRSAGGVPHAPLSASHAHPRVWGFGASRSLNSRGFTVTLIVAHDEQQPPKAGNRKIAPIRKCTNRNPETPTNSPWKVAPLIIEIQSENQK